MSISTHYYDIRTLRGRLLSLSLVAMILSAEFSLEKVLGPDTGANS